MGLKVWVGIRVGVSNMVRVGVGVRGGPVAHNSVPHFKPARALM